MPLLPSSSPWALATSMFPTPLRSLLGVSHTLHSLLGVSHPPPPFSIGCLTPLLSLLGVSHPPPPFSIGCLTPLLSLLGPLHSLIGISRPLLLSWTPSYSLWGVSHPHLLYRRLKSPRSLQIIVPFLLCRALYSPSFSLGCLSPPHPIRGEVPHPSLSTGPPFSTGHLTALFYGSFLSFPSLGITYRFLANYCSYYQCYYSSYYPLLIYLPSLAPRAPSHSRLHIKNPPLLALSVLCPAKHFVVTHSTWITLFCTHASTLPT